MKIKMNPGNRHQLTIPSLFFILLMVLLPVTALAQQTLVVNSVGDAADSSPGNNGCDTGNTISTGAPECTLRAAIQEANDDALADTINFIIPGNGVHTILPGTGLPEVTQPVIIDASTQPGYSGTPIIEINGANAVGNEVYGLSVLGGNSTIRALAIFNFSFTGLRLQTGGQNIVAGNHIGTDAAGMVDRGNNFDGLAIIDSSHNVIGGTTAAERNVIAGNRDFGLVILNAPSTDNQVIGNYIGTDVTGSNVLGNGLSGVLLSAAVGETQYSSDNIIGGAGPGEANVISGNFSNGIQIFRSPRNQIIGNFIGVNQNGIVAVANAQDGVLIEDAADNQIGGGVPNGGNVISGNGRDGIVIGGALATGNQVEANYIGTGLSGNAAIANGRIGILLTSFGAGLPSSGTVIGSIEPMFGNVISGNARDGIQVGFGSDGNTIIGNYIGTSADGAAAVANQRHGLSIFDCDNNVVGGTANGAENIISGNTGNGILIARGALGQGSKNNKVEGNTIGLGADGSTMLGNEADGIFLRDSGPNTIGGTNIDSGNTISGNDGSGIHVRGVDAKANILKGNIIGTDRLATEFKANGFDGIHIEGSPDTVIGGSMPAEANIIAGNEGSGVFVVENESTGTIIHGNFIGTNTLDDELGNDEYGIKIQDSSDNEIGGTEMGEGNTIAFNGFVLEQRGHGILIDGGTGNAIRKNSIFKNLGRGISLVDKRFPASIPYSFNIPDPSEDLSGNLSVDDSEDFNRNGKQDFADADTGSNGLQNYPLVTHVEFDTNANTKKVEWTLYGRRNSDFLIDLFENDDADPSGFGEGQRFLKSVEVHTDAHGHGVFSETFDLETVDGQLIGPLVSATATDSLSNTSEISMIDTDGDAIADQWEKLGIDINEDGVRDYPLSPGTVPISDFLHKDIFVEVDSMATTVRFAGLKLAVFRATAAEQNDLVSAFASVPNEFVKNPLGKVGVVLHLDMDETIPHHQWLGDADGDDGKDETFDNDGWAFFYKIKNSGTTSPVGGFGTPAERKNRLTIAAKKLIYRYAIFADTIGETDPMTMRQVESTTLGIGEVTYGGTVPSPDTLHVDGGNDFFIAMGTMDTPGGTTQEKTGTFMHELGHTLGLMHGGVDHLNQKPNYHSIMNYTWVNAHPSYAASWFLDYSRKAFDPLDETAIDEAVGMGGNPALMVPVGPPGFMGNTLIWAFDVVNEGGPVDLDGNMIFTDVRPVDLNYFADEDLSVPPDGVINALDIRLETLTSRADWPSLRFNFLGTPGTANAVHIEGAVVDEPTRELSHGLDAIGDTAGEFAFSVSLAEVDEDAGIVAVSVRRIAGTVGAVSVDFETVDDSAMADLDYMPASGTLNFINGEIYQTIEVKILDDPDPEANEVLQIQLSNPMGGATLGSDTFFLGIRANDGAGDIQFSNPFFDVQEDVGTATVTVVRVGGTSGAVGIDFGTADSLALEGEDYSASSGTLNFADGVASQSIKVPITQDMLIEGNEGLMLSLSNPTGGANLGPINQAALTILNVATPAARFDFSSPSYEVDEAAGLQTIEVVRSRIIDTEVSVELMTADDSATAGEDYTMTNVSLMFLAGEVSKMVDVPILSDTLLEGIERLELKLVNLSDDALLGDIGVSEIIIIDDEIADGVFEDGFEG